MISALAISLGGAVAGVVTASAAHADSAVTSGSLNWGFKQSFRTYVGNQTAALPPIGPLPVGERITMIAPATFDASATPVDEKRPYTFPASSGQLDSASSLSIATTGGVHYHFPSHYFEVKIENPRLVVSGTTGTIYADTYLNATEAFGDFPQGEFSGTQVALATVGNVSVTLNGDGTSATITGTNVTMTAQGAEYVPLYSEGDQLDNLTATASATGGGEEPTPTEPDGKVTLSKASFNADGDTVTVTGSGFLPTVLGTRPPLSGKPAGVYVVFGRFAADWQPSQGAPSTARKGSPASEGGTKWAVLEEDKATVGGDAAGAITLNPDGTFTATLNVKKDFTGAPDEGRYGIYTYAGSGGVSAAYETFTPITFTTTSTDQQTITAIIPEPEPGGEFSWTIDADDHTVSLGTAENKGAYLQATGQLKPVKVTDTRTNQANAWSVSGQVSDFTGGLSGKYLGWTPKLIEAGTDAVVGSPVASGYVGGAGLSQSSLLGSAPDEHEQGTATLGADLDLRVPVETEPGTYSATLTLTALS